MRYKLVSENKEPWQKLVDVTKLLDHLEHDFHEVYPDLEPPMLDGYEGTLRRLFEEKYKDK